MRTFKRIGSAALLGVLVAIAATTSSRTIAQTVMRVYGTVSGAPIPLAADSSGRLQVTLAGGTATPSAVSISQGTLSADAQAISTTATWNNAGVTFTGWKENITDSASASGSLLIDLQVGGSSKFNVTKAGNLTATNQILSGGQVVAGTNVFAGASSRIAFTSSTRLASPSDGVLTLSNAAETDFTRLQFGGTTSSFPALLRNGNSLRAVLADNSAFATFEAKGYYMGSLIMVSTAPTISSGFGTSPSIASNNGTAVFTVNVGTGGTASSGVIGMPTAANGWACNVNMEAVVPTTLTKQTANTTTSVTVTNYTVSTGATAAWAASTILTLTCAGR